MFAAHAIDINRRHAAFSRRQRARVTRAAPRQMRTMFERSAEIDMRITGDITGRTERTRCYKDMICAIAASRATPTPLHYDSLISLRPRHAPRCFDKNGMEHRR